jgi:hypothetical protein
MGHDVAMEITVVIDMRWFDIQTIEYRILRESSTCLHVRYIENSFNGRILHSDSIVRLPKIGLSNPLIGDESVATSPKQEMLKASKSRAPPHPSVQCCKYAFEFLGIT